MWSSESMILLERGIGSDINAEIDLLLATAVPEATRLRSIPVGENDRHGGDIPGMARP
jgi:hypothetical protein